MSVPAWLVRDQLDPHWAGVVHLDRSSAEWHVSQMGQFIRVEIDPVIEAVEASSIEDQRVTVHGWMIGQQLNRRSMGKRSFRAPVRSLRLAGDRIAGEVLFNGQAVPVVRLADDRWSSYVDDFNTAEG